MELYDSGASAEIIKK